MKKKLPVIATAPRDVVSSIPTSAHVDLDDVATVLREGMLALSVSAGLSVLQTMMCEEMTERIGLKHAKLSERSGNWHGSTRGAVALGGTKQTITRPRGRSNDGEEITLATWTMATATDLLDQLTVERMLAGVATRRHGDVEAPAGVHDDTARATTKSSVSRRFIKATEQAMTELLSRDLSEHDVAALFIDGFDVAKQCMVAAVILTTEGVKIPVGLWLGDTENTTVVKSLLADLVARGLRYKDGILCVVDGAKALRAGITRVFGDRVVVQRCTIHKRRNVADHLPEEIRGTTDLKLKKAFDDTDPTRGKRIAEGIATQLQAHHPDAAASLREGLDDLFTVKRLGASDLLAKTLINTNVIESMISIARRTNRNVKKWKDGEMKKRWCAAGMLEAERSFRRVKGYADLPAFVEQLHTQVAAQRGDTTTPTNHQIAAGL